MGPPSTLGGPFSRHLPITRIMKEQLFYMYTALGTEVPEGAKLHGEQKYLDGMRVVDHDFLLEMGGTYQTLNAVLPGSRAEELITCVNNAKLSWEVAVFYEKRVHIKSSSPWAKDNEARDYAFETNIVKGTEAHELLRLLIKRFDILMYYSEFQAFLLLSLGFRCNLDSI